jgi:hypothetical protein
MSETFMQKLEQKQKLQPKPLDEIPEEIKLKWIDETFKQDQTNRECLFVTLETEEHQQVKQKYTATMYETLHEAIIQCGSIEKLKQEFHTYRKQQVGKRGSFPRLYPIPQETRHKKQ